MPQNIHLRLLSFQKLFPRRKDCIRDYLRDFPLGTPPRISTGIPSRIPPDFLSGLSRVLSSKISSGSFPRDSSRPVSFQGFLLVFLLLKFFRYFPQNHYANSCWNHSKDSCWNSSREFHYGVYLFGVLRFKLEACALALILPNGKRCMIADPILYLAASAAINIFLVGSICAVGTRMTDSNVLLRKLSRGAFSSFICFTNRSLIAHR